MAYRKQKKKKIAEKDAKEKLHSALVRITALSALTSNTQAQVYWDTLHEYFITDGNLERYRQLFATITNK